MVKAELNYNPYLLETSVRFNGQLPRINSLVEKFQKGALEDWIEKVPKIFHDEMNGYDFELDFSGTGLDFEELQKAFAEAGVTEEMVRIFHRNELEGRKQKTDDIDALLKWLEGHPNRNFDLVAFLKDTELIFDSAYTYIVFQGSILEPSLPTELNISIENISSMEELKETELSNTPILYYISQETLAGLQGNLKAFLSREDIKEQQLFFLINPQLDSAKAERIIQDLGIEKPQIVSDIYDPQVLRYMELYPVSKYIYEADRAFRERTDELGKQLKEKIEESAIVNKGIHEQIDGLEDDIQRLKTALNKFVNRDNIILPDSWTRTEEEFLNSINIWRNRKTKITDDAEAYTAANDFNSAVQSYFADFMNKLELAVGQSLQQIDENYLFWYVAAEADKEFSVDESKRVFLDRPELSDVSLELLKIKEEQYVQPKEDIFNRFFRTAPEEPKEPVLERTYYYQNWRSYVLDVVTPIEIKIIQDYYEVLKTYEKKIAEAYICHIEELIDLKSKEKEEVSSQLSEDERLLQNDEDWLTAVCDHLDIIERK